MREFMQIITEASHGQTLFTQYGGTVYALRDLPHSGKNAVQAYFVDEHGQHVSPDSRWGYVEVPTAALKEIIGGYDDHADFDSYHDWYVDGGDMPDHQTADYAIILDDNDIIYDGWHRFHDYVRKGIEVIPAIIPLGD